MYCKFAILFIFHFASCENINDGRCPDLQTIPNFIIEDYMGNWYEVMRYDSKYFISPECSLNTYSSLQPNGTFQINVQAKFNSADSDGIWLEKEGIGFEQNPNMEDGKLRMLYPNSARHWSDYWVLDTDFVSYAVVWNCIEIHFANFQIVWVYTRTPYLHPEVKLKVYEVLDMNGLSKEYLIESRQDDEFCGKRPKKLL